MNNERISKFPPNHLTLFPCPLVPLSTSISLCLRGSVANTCSSGLRDITDKRTDERRKDRRPRDDLSAPGGHCSGAGRQGACGSRSIREARGRACGNRL